MFSAPEDVYKCSYPWSTRGRLLKLYLIGYQMFSCQPHSHDSCRKQANMPSSRTDSLSHPEWKLHSGKASAPNVLPWPSQEIGYALPQRKKLKPMFLWQRKFYLPTNRFFPAKSNSSPGKELMEPSGEMTSGTAAVVEGLVVVGGLEVSNS